MNQKNCYAVVYPLGTDYTYELFDDFAEACELLDQEANKTHTCANRGQKIYLYELRGGAQEVDNMIWEASDAGSAIQWIEENAIQYESVDSYELQEAYAVKKADGSIINFGNREEEAEFEAVDNGGEVTEGWEDEIEFYETEEEAVEANNPSQYLIKF